MKKFLLATLFCLIGMFSYSQVVFLCKYHNNASQTDMKISFNPENGGKYLFELSSDNPTPPTLAVSLKDDLNAMVQLLEDFRHNYGCWSSIVRTNKIKTYHKEMPIFFSLNGTISWFDEGGEICNAGIEIFHPKFIVVDGIPYLYLIEKQELHASNDETKTVTVSWFFSSLDDFDALLDCRDDRNRPFWWKLNEH